ncbi:hypothetical protein CAPTEDRAFT_108853 [Capitella teleta]|uniref:Large ribosomal subunit protein uL22m n=1 Tax=Capitella teleta TaxID=283909 RepID=R7TEL5_CAPTE|nr:hypothetical protein CAPTEDRAFT_108853 [Capitella teleta]|eukprot:ELT89506.1 hypothetical protein CAPTEDRAFT_108853 [Capitella teleta]
MQSRLLHTTPVTCRKLLPSTPQFWPQYNDVVYPPREPGLPLRPAEITHHVSNVKYSLRKMWYIAAMIRGMSVDEALKQLSFIERKGSLIAKEAIEDAIDIAVSSHNVEFRSNLWIADSFATKAIRHKGYRKTALRGYKIIKYDYIHYFVRLREGRPPKHYFAPPPNGHEKMAEYLQQKRNRRIIKAL